MAWNYALNGRVLECWDADENSKKATTIIHEKLVALSAFFHL